MEKICHVQATKYTVPGSGSREADGGFFGDGAALNGEIVVHPLSFTAAYCYTMSAAKNTVIPHRHPEATYGRD